MDTLILDVPAMYGDHHVIEVRRILLEISGVVDIYASSYLKTIEVVFDPAQVDADSIKTRLAEAGYLQEFVFPHETGVAACEQDGNSTFFRHTAAHKQTGMSVSFVQMVNHAARPLFPCPGMKPAAKMDEGE